MKRYARCAKCKRFLATDNKANKVSSEECPNCTYRTSRCQECGGERGVQRSILSHHNWFRTRGHGAGGHARIYRMITERVMRRLVDIGREVA